MKICIPTETNQGLKAKVYAHFGSAPYFTVYDTEKETCECVENDNQHHMHGMCQPLGMICEQNINAVVCAGMGSRAVQKLNEAGIRAYRALGGNVAEIINMFKRGGLEEITVEKACIQHDCQ